MEDSTRRRFLTTAGRSLGMATLGGPLAGLAWADTESQQKSPGEQSSGAPALPITAARNDPFRSARFANDRTDNELVATLGTCYQSDFRFFTMLRQDAWNFMRWETLGNAVQEHRTWNHWPYEQHARVSVNGAELSPELAAVDQVEQQFDFRRIEVSSPFVNIDRLDLMMSGRQWMTALRISNQIAIPVKVVVELEWTGRKKEPLDVRPCSDQGGAGFAYSIANGPPILVALSSGGTWEKAGAGVVRSRWEVTLQPGEVTALVFNVHIGWATMPQSEEKAFEDHAPGKPNSDKLAALDRLADRNGFRAATAALGIRNAGEGWEDLEQICDLRRKYLYERMPRLRGFSPESAGMWSYIFDLTRSGVYPAQGNFHDVWMVSDLIVYREPFAWDGPGAVHSFCHWDADIAARTLKTYVTAATQPDGMLPVSSNPYRISIDHSPQLANNAMALWDCYQATRDKVLLADCYPSLVRHIRWLETKGNGTPKGPLMDVGHNIDYGPPELYQTTTIWPDVQFFLVDCYRKLGQIAKLIDRPVQEHMAWTDKAEHLAKAIRQHMWDDKVGTFWCLTGKLTFKPIPSPIEFHCMATGVASREQARRLLMRLNDPAKYAPNANYSFGLPSAPFDSPLFKVTDSWSGTIWPIQTYYTVRGLVAYGYQDEASGLAKNLYRMMARNYRETGTIYEQYDPHSGRDLSVVDDPTRVAADFARGYFISGIATCASDLLLRGVFGFERSNDPAAFYLAPRPMGSEWHGIENLQLNGAVRLSIHIKSGARSSDCKVTFTGLENGVRTVRIHRINLEDDTSTLLQEVAFDDHKALAVNLEQSTGVRYLWEVH